MSAFCEPADRSTRILAIRHGLTDWNSQQRVQGQLDIALNAHGHAQAAALVPALQETTFAAIYCSDLQRARDTAAPFARASQLPVMLEAGLRERAFGVFEGLTYAEIEALWPEGAAAWRRRDLSFAPPGGESLPQFQERAVSTVVRLAAQHPGQTIAVVAHGGVLDALYRSASRSGPQAPRTWQLDNAAINRLLLADEGLMLIGWNDCGHLEGV